MNIDPAAPAASGTPAGPAQAPANTALMTPSEVVIHAPWSNSQGVYTIGEGDQAKPWWHAVPEKDARDLMEAKQYKNPAEVALAYHNANKMLNAQGNQIVAPAVDADQKEWDAFYTKLGRPESADKYELKAAEGTQIDENLVKLGKDIFFGLGATPAKAQEAMDKWNAFVAESVKTAQEQQRVDNEKALSALATKWGADLEQNKAAGMRVLNALGLPAETMDAVENQLGSATVVEFLAAIGRKTGEGGFVGSGSRVDPSDPSTMTADQAAERLNSLRGDSQFMDKYLNKNHPQHKEAVSTMEKLFARAG